MLFIVINKFDIQEMGNSKIFLKYYVGYIINK